MKFATATVALSTLALCAQSTLAASGSALPLRRRHVAFGRRSNPYAESSYDAPKEAEKYDSGKGSNYESGAYGSKESSSYGEGYGYEAPTKEAAMEHETTEEKMKYESTTMMHDSSTAMAHETSTMMMHEQTTSAMHDSTTSAYEEKSTAKAEATMAYGSGSYGNAGSYDSCVQQCQAQYGGQGMTYASGEKATETAKAGKAEATGAPAAGEARTAENPLIASSPNEIIVAPFKGNLVMVPFNLDVEKGTEIKWTWGAGPHTVTESSALSICNKSLEAGAFVSGQQNATFEFPQTISTDAPKYYFCGVATHCQKGMFGTLNAGKVSEVSSKTSFDSYMKSYADSNPEFKKSWTETSTKVKGSSAESWGSLIDTSNIEEWARPMAAMSILATREYYMANPRLLAVASNATAIAATSANGAVAAAGATDSSSAAASATAASAQSAEDSSSAASSTKLAGSALAMSLFAGALALLV